MSELKIDIEAQIPNMLEHIDNHLPKEVGEVLGMRIVAALGVPEDQFLIATPTSRASIDLVRTGLLKK